MVVAPVVVVVVVIVVLAEILVELIIGAEVKAALYCKSCIGSIGCCSGNICNNSPSSISNRRIFKIISGSMDGGSGSMDGGCGSNGCIRIA